MYKRYEALRDARKVNDATVAKATDISPVVFSEWKKGKSNPKVDKLIRIAKYFDVPLEDLVGDGT